MIKRARRPVSQGRTDMVLESYMVVLFGAVIVVQQFIMYLMYVRIRQLLREIDSIEGKMKITDHELDNLIQKVEEFKQTGM
jgi:hypothetical protein